MPLYTVRYRLQPLNVAPRGVPWVEMTHHLVMGSDDDAEASMPGLVAHVNDAGLTSRWVVVRGGPAHFCTIYRRSVEDWSRWTKVAEQAFTMPEYQTAGGQVTFQGVDIDLEGGEAAIFPAGREAVCVTEKAANGSKRRVFVGPVSPCAIVLRGSLPGPFDPAVTLWTPGLAGDYPYDPETDLPNLHRGDLAGLARDHVHDLQASAVGAYSVVVSPKNGTVSGVVSTRASLVKAALSTRSSRGPTTDEATNPIVPG